MSKKLKKVMKAVEELKELLKAIERSKLTVVEKPKKPVCKITTTHGNPFDLMAHACSAMINDAKIRANQMIKKCQKARSHKEIIQIIKEYVEIG